MLVYLLTLIVLAATAWLGTYNWRNHGMTPGIFTIVVSLVVGWLVSVIVWGIFAWNIPAERTEINRSVYKIAEKSPFEHDVSSLKFVAEKEDGSLEPMDIYFEEDITYASKEINEVEVVTYKLTNDWMLPSGATIREVKKGFVR